MAHVFPPEITDADVASMLAALANETPYTGTAYGEADRELACFDFDAHSLTVRVALPNREYDTAGRRAFEEAIILLPRLHGLVAKRYARKPDDGSDDIQLLLMEVEGDEVYMLYSFVAYNAQPEFWFSKACHGGPLRPVVFAPEWRTDTAVTLARQMAESHDYGAMPILADALQDAGCDSDDVLNHCRDPHHAHGREGWGCWVVDGVLGKK
jgi:hypothetical protein